MAVTVRSVVHVDANTSSPGGGAVYDPAVNPYGTYGGYKPGAATTGLPAGVTQSQLTVRTGTAGDFVITAGGTYDLVNFQCRVLVKTAAVVTFTRCLFNGPPSATTNTGLLDLNNNPGTSSNVRVYDSTFAASQPSHWLDGVIGHDFILERCDIHNVTDGVGLGGTLSGGTNANGTLRGCWIHDLSLFSPDTTNGTSERASTHNDCVQWFGGNGYTTRGNFFDGRINPSIGAAQLSQANRDPVIGGGPDNPFAVSTDAYGYNPNYPNMVANSAFQFNNNTGPLSGWNSDSDWFGGGGYSINIGASVGGSCTNGRFARSYLYGPISAPAPGVSATVTTDFTGCVYEDNGAAVSIYRGP